METETEQSPEPLPALLPKPVPGLPASEPELEPDPEPEPEPVPDPEPEPVPESDPEPDQPDQFEPASDPDESEEPDPVPTLELPVGKVPMPPSLPAFPDPTGKTVIVDVVVEVIVVVRVGSSPPEGAGVAAPSKPVGTAPLAVIVIV